MKPWMIRSSSFVLTASLLLPLAQAHAQSPEAATSKMVNSTQMDKATLAATSKVKLSKEAALTLAAKLVPTSGLTLTNVSFRSADGWRSFPEWSFGWNKKDPNNEKVLLSYSVSINANTGELTSYSHYDQSRNNLPYAKRVSYADARTAAEQFLQKHNPGKAAETRLYLRELPEPKTPLSADVSYTFRFVRVVDDVLFPDNGADITVNGAGVVSDFSLSWNDVKFEKPDKQISLEEAEKLFQEQADPKLSYLLPWKRTGAEKNTVTLGYTNPFTFYLDAQSGKALNQSLSPRSESNEPVAVSSKPLSPRRSGGALSQEEAIAWAAKTFDLGNYELRSANYSERDYQGNRSVWNLEYTEKGKEKDGYVFVAFDAVTGDVYSYSKDRPLRKEEEKPAKTVDPKKLQAAAMETIRKWTPTSAHQLYLVERDEEGVELLKSSRYRITLERYIDGIAAASGSAYLNYDAQTGELLSYSADFGSETYPAKVPKHLSGDEAVQAWWKESEAEAVYALEPLSEEDNKKVQEQPSYIPKRTAKLVYRVTSTPFEQPYYLDAATGEWRSTASGKVLNLHRQAPLDLKGHPAEKELLLMYEYDALSLEDGKILPQKPITRGEMIEMLMISLNQGRHYPMYSLERKATYSDVANGSRFFSAVEGAVDRGLLDKNASKLNPDEPITREELADMIVRALGYNKLADYPGMFQSPLTDIGNAKHRASIIIATTLGIVPTDKTKFQPQGAVSRADAAVTFTRFLEKRGNAGTESVFIRD
ncbi:S-layer homology domain-containing protein [Brevibacillus agri]|uniref:S-layer homology domain-containing protein n=1 Tax=Brevibacillus agri TaxID=51101 RepID=UPI001EE4F980|nr:S-layer homology domain-containing protein [Brevibacillus agri]MCG5250916.1 S-layer homology domain-containing protein [Brevibacillus agri]